MRGLRHRGWRRRRLGGDTDPRPVPHLIYITLCHCDWELKIKFNSLTNEILIDEMDADGQGHPGLGAPLRYRPGPLDWDRRCICPACFPTQSIRSPRHHPPSMRARPAIPIGREIASSFRASRVRPIQLIRSAHMVGAHSKLTFGLSNMRGSRAARGWLPSRGRAARPVDRIANSPELWRAAASAFICEWPPTPTGFAGRS
jgi:hypothetical protein